ncbi:hypothetical protein SHK09_14405 [Polaribacter sp. PL03]|nr:hypothetical protein [Polaribacter sp. PL03]MDX6747987.1 hypothetical protein [Polaribacter sp. PL03]
MRKEQYNTSVAVRNNHPNFVKKRQSWTNNFVQWFHNFLEAAE